LLSTWARIDAIAADPLQAARESQVVLLAVPIYATLDFMEKLAGVLGSEHLVTDVGSTKAQISEAAGRSSTLRIGRRFCPATPWRARSGAARSWPMRSLFRGAVWLFTDDPECKRSPHSAALVKDWREWVRRMGAKTIDLDSRASR
jgi:prephenate dehydrogenase